MRDRPPAAPNARAGWRSRRDLPQFDSPGTILHVVFRLADAIPGPIMDRRERVPAANRLVGIADALRQRHGERLPAAPHLATLVETALLHFDRERCRLLAWCVMPTHVHALLEQVDGHRLAHIVPSWTSYTGTRSNRFPGRRGAFWASEYYDRFMRDEVHPEATRSYVESNPVTAGLCSGAAGWRFSSAWTGRRRGG